VNPNASAATPGSSQPQPAARPPRDHAGRPPRRWPAEQVFLAVIFSVVGAGMCITSAVSYEHEYVLARANGQVRWVAALVPFTLDGMILVAGAALLWAAMYGVRGLGRLWQPGGVMLAGIAATIAANYYSDVRVDWLGPAVSASSGVAVVLMSAVAFWLLGEVRRVARGEQPQPALNCSCPPSPVSLAEALPLAKARLLELGEHYGEAALADRFCVSRHQVRQSLAQAVTAMVAEPSLNGSAS
jgi:hypothetical protein